MTYAELKRAALVLLDIHPNSSGDLALQVEYQLSRIMDELAVAVLPKELLTLSDSFNITSATTSVDLAADMGITNMLQPFRLVVDEDITDTLPGTPWKFRSFEAWITTTDRAVREWTIDYRDKILLSQWPAAGQTWSVSLYFYKQPAAYAAGGTPELPPGHHHALVLGSVISFPNLFQGERESLLVKHQSDYNKAKEALLRHRGLARSDLTFSVRGGNPTNRLLSSGLTWGT